MNNNEPKAILKIRYIHVYIYLIYSYFTKSGLLIKLDYND